MFVLVVLTIIVKPMQLLLYNHYVYWTHKRSVTTKNILGTILGKQRENVMFFKCKDWEHCKPFLLTSKFKLLLICISLTWPATFYLLDFLWLSKPLTSHTVISFKIYKFWNTRLHRTLLKSFKQNLYMAIKNPFTL